MCIVHSSFLFSTETTGDVQETGGRCHHPAPDGGTDDRAENARLGQEDAAGHKHGRSTAGDRCREGDENQRIGRTNGETETGGRVLVVRGL